MSLATNLAGFLHHSLYLEKLLENQRRPDSTRYCLINRKLSRLHTACRNLALIISSLLTTRTLNDKCLLKLIKAIKYVDEALGLVKTKDPETKEIVDGCRYIMTIIETQLKEYK